MPKPKTTPPSIDPSFMGKAILVVEDHEDSRDLLAMSFRLIGARVFAVGSLTDAQRAFARHTPDLVVCDLKLPDGTGLEFVVWVRALTKGRGRDIPCIALTGFDGGEARTIADAAVHIDSANYGVIEDVHQAVMHLMAQYIRQAHMPADAIAATRF